MHGRRIKTALSSRGSRPKIEPCLNMLEKQGTSAEKEFVCTLCYSNPRKENGMSFTQEETLQSGAL